MAKQIREMDSGKTHPGLKFMYWQKFCWDTEDLPIGFIQSMQMDKKSPVSLVLNYIFLGFQCNILPTVKLCHDGDKGPPKASMFPILCQGKKAGPAKCEARSFSLNPNCKTARVNLHRQI